MTSIVSAITGSGSIKAGKVQAAAAEQGMAEQRAGLKEAMGYERGSLAIQKDMLRQALEMGQPYRAAGDRATAAYESALYGIPLGQTAAYQSALKPMAGQQGGIFGSQADMASAIKPMFSSSKKEYQNRDLFYDPNTGTVSFDGGVPLGIKSSSKSGAEGLEEAVSKAWANYQAQQQQPVDVSYMGDPNAQTDFQASPGYQFRMDEGQKAVERTAAARGGLLSGAATKASQRYAQGLASSEFQSFMDRLAGLSGQGATMSSQGGNQAITSGSAQGGVLNNMANLRTGNADNITQLLSQQAAAKASGYLGRQQAGTNTLNMLAGFAGSSFGGGGTIGGFSPGQWGGKMMSSSPMGPYQTPGARIGSYF